jgi:predicted TIM-barrel fold metal-dependent hydrolase
MIEHAMRAARSIDCHAHIIDPARFPFDDGPGYRPASHEVGTLADYVISLEGAGVAHSLLVQPSGYGTDNRALLDALARQPARFKGIAVVAPEFPDAELDRLGTAGVVGARFNLASYRTDGLRGRAAEMLLARLAERGWYAQVHATDPQWAETVPVLRRTGVRVLVDHFGVSDPALGTAAPGFQGVLALGREGRGAVKLSAAYRIGDPARLDHHAAALLAAFGPDRCVWGSDWPFLAAAGPPAYADTLALLARWLPDAAERARVLWQTPARLFGFAP